VLYEVNIHTITILSTRPRRASAQFSPLMLLGQDLSVLGLIASFHDGHRKKNAIMQDRLRAGRGAASGHVAE